MNRVRREQAVRAMAGASTTDAKVRAVRQAMDVSDEQAAAIVHALGHLRPSDVGEAPQAAADTEELREASHYSADESAALMAAREAVAEYAARIGDDPSPGQKGHLTRLQNRVEELEAAQ